MGLFDFFTKKPSLPYKNKAFNTIYDLLFCDDIDLCKSNSKSSAYPFNILYADKVDIEQVKVVANDKALESRHRILAYNLLLRSGVGVNERELLGVIVEVSLSHGLDVLGAFSDGTARYINHAEKMIVWETKTDESNHLINQLFSHSVIVINQIGPWDQNRKPFPEKGNIRLTFLVSDGLYFGEGLFPIFQTDPMAGPVILSATQLLNFLTVKSITNKGKPL